MYTLILDSTYKDLCVGLAKDNILIDSIIYEAWQKQSEYMVEEIQNILKQNNVDPKEINEVIVTNGPGSYTGVRIALTIAKIYCYCLKIPCYVLSSLKVLQKINKTSICIINARSNRSYIGVYKNNEVLLNDMIMKNEDVLNYIDKHKEYALCGDLLFLGLEGQKENIINNMLSLKNDKNKIDDIFNLKAIYLKD